MLLAEICAQTCHTHLTAALSLPTACQAEDIRSAVKMLQNKGKTVMGLLGAAALTWMTLDM